MRAKTYGNKFKLKNNRPLYYRNNEADTVIVTVNNLNASSRFYVDYMVGLLKTEKAWELALAFYGFVGETAQEQKWNWRDMRDLDDAFRLTFINDVKHTASGIKGDGTGASYNTGAVVDTHINPSLNVDSNYFSMAIYNNLPPSHNGSSVGVINNNFGRYERNLWVNRSTLKIYYNKNKSTTYNSGPAFAGLSFLYANASGLFMMNKNAKTPATQSNVGDGSDGYANGNIVLLNRSYYNDGTFAFYDYGTSEQMATTAFFDGEVSDAMAYQISRIITFSQKILNRS